MKQRIRRQDERHLWRSLVIAVLTSTFAAPLDAESPAAGLCPSSVARAAAQPSAQVEADEAREARMPAPEATADASIEVIEAGWDGAAVRSTWTPVRLRVTAGARELRGLAEVIVEYEFRPSPQAPRIRYPMGAYGREVAVPAGGSLDLVVWVPAEGSLEARLSTGAETLAETAVPLDMTRDGWPLVAVLADAPAVARTLGAIELPYQGLPIALAVAELAPHAIPASSQRFGAVTALVVQGAATAELTGSQRDAVLDWVRRGGHLLVAGGPGGAQSLRVLPERAVAISHIDAVASAPISGLGTWLGSRTDVPSSAPLARFRSTDAVGGAVLAGDSEAPLAWRAPLGRGTVTVLAVDPGIEPLASWAGNVALLEAALAPALTQNTEEAGWSAFAPAAMMLPALGMQGVMSLLPPDAHPRWSVAALLLAGFAIAVGPVLYLALRLIDRRELSWIAIPAAAAGLSMGLYVWGTRISGSDLITNVASYIEVGENGAPAQQSVAAGFYGAMHRELTVPLRGELLARPLADPPRTFLAWIMASGGYAVDAAELGVPTEPPFQAIDGASRRVRFTSGQYATRAVLFETELADAPRVHTELTVDGNLLTGSIRNETGLPLEDAAVIVGTNVARLGALAPGQSVTVRLEATADSPMRRYEPLSQLVFGEPMRGPGVATRVPPGYPEPRVVPNDPEIRRRANFLDAALAQYGPRSSIDGTTRPLTFLAFTRRSTVDEIIQPPDRATHHLTLLRQPLELVFEPGPFVVPPELIPPEQLAGSASHGMGSGANGQLHWIELSAGSLVFSFRPPLPANARAETLILKTEEIGTAIATGPRPGVSARRRRATPPTLGDTATAAAAGVFSLYDWRKATWVPLPEGSEHRIEAGPYVGPDGEVRVQIANPANAELRFVVPSLAIEGRVEEGVLQ